MRDQIEADLARHLERVDSTLLAIVLRQIGLAHDIAAEISRHVASCIRAGRSTDGKSWPPRPSRIEQKADRIAIEARKEIARLNARPIIEQLVDRVEEAVDELEQAAFIASLLPAGIDATPVSALAALCAIATSRRPRPQPRASPRRSKCRKGAAPIPRMRSPRSVV